MFDPVAYINEPRWRSMSLGLERISELLERLGNPQDVLRFVHVAGTNGKGSTCAFVSAILQQAGYRVGLFTSPYIDHFEERIRVDGSEISHDDLVSATLRVREAAEAMDSHPTEFELMTAVAFEHFARTECDIVVCEVGLGGRLDSTNVITSVEVCAFAPISYDHCAMLGSTLGQIANEKAGILKRGASAVSAPQEPEVREVLSARASELDVPLRYIDLSQIAGTNECFSFAGLDGLSIPLQGSYQLVNASLAVLVCRALAEKGWSIDEGSIRRGLAGASWPGRFEFLGHEPDVIIDGAHNIHAIRALAHELSGRYEEGGIVFVVGVMADKDYVPMLKLLAPLANSFVCYEPGNPRALPASELASAVGRALAAVGCSGQVGTYQAPTPDAAVSRARELSCGRLPICFCGSLYGIAAMKEAWKR